MKPFIILVLLIAYLPFTSFAQSDLLSLLEEGETEEPSFALATFKGSRLINGHTVMTRRAGTLEFLIAHRFGRINSGAYELFGIDNANVRFGIDYGLSNTVTVGVGRNSFEKTYDAFAKVALLRQQSGLKEVPVSVTGFFSIAAKTLKSTNPEVELSFSDRLSYTYQLLLARKFSESLSLQLMPSYLHYNLVERAGQENDLLSLGIGGRLKVTKRMSVNMEYYTRFGDQQQEDLHNALAIGIDLETGGHVFQFQLTNSRAMIEKGFIRETTGDFFAGDIHLGFNITRTF